MTAKSYENHTKLSKNGTKIKEKCSIEPPEHLWKEKLSFLIWNVPPNGGQMGAKQSQNRVKIESEKKWVFVLVFSSFSDGFWDVKVVQNHPKSLPEDVREWKRRLPENVGFTIVKPWFSKPEAPQNKVILERKSLQASVAEWGRKNTQKKYDVWPIWWPKRSPFRAKTVPKNKSKKRLTKVWKSDFFWGPFRKNSIITDPPVGY